LNNFLLKLSKARKKGDFVLQGNELKTGKNQMVLKGGKNKEKITVLFFLRKRI